ncbi:MAG: AAA family ATPase [Candidatus Moraniibacteriota bacterium]|nr:MAG: AAA family ATPase [Candidatus Moranbacteria bacterium]
MYLQKIILNGFKSFATKTELFFCVLQKDRDPDRIGVTAIVGPNGSGKSNIVDALRWVMGEQSTKSLRAKKSHDVIFSGSKKRSMMSSGTVTLVFDNSDKKMDVDYQDVLVTRKIYKSGEGEYLINGTQVRLLDVIDLFASIGIGKESQCVLNQGMSDAILSASSMERRSILEEAAGVKPYQIKRDRSIKRLITTRENLLITGKLIEEIEPRLRILKRQSKRAEQRREIEDQLRIIQSSYYRVLWKRFSCEYEEFQSILLILEKEENVLEQKLQKYISQQSSVSNKMQETSQSNLLQKKIALLRREISEFERKRSQCQGMIDVEKERKNHQRIFDVIPVDLPFVRKRLLSLKKSFQEMNIIFGREKKVSLEERKKFLDNFLEEIDSLYEDCAQSTVRIGREKEILEKERKFFEEKIQKGEEQVQEFSREILKKEKEILKKEKEILLLEADTKNASTLYFSLEKEIVNIRENLYQVRKSFNEKKIAFTRCEIRKEDLEREIQSELGRDPKSLALEIGEDIQANDETFRFIERLKSQLAMIGGIDPMIAQEYSETNERYSFLVREHNDLEQAVISLEKVIREMNIRIEKDFSEAFEKINQEFGKYFTLMFDGGTASLEKVKEFSEDQEEEEDKFYDEYDEVLINERKYAKWGVDIIVKPPKKKIDQLGVLSGGERSLVSLALLFAIISYNPPPFVFLDEVEASLDETNSKRFGNLLRTLSSRTQFIVITHNRETMQKADVLYGVTMEDGVSQILSVRLDQMKKDGNFIK